MTNPPLARAIDFIRNRQNPDGGWGYGPGRASLVEPTAFCSLALLANGEKASSGRGLDFLRACQLDSGAVGVKPGQAEGNWMAYAALLAFHGLGAADEERRLKAWVLSFEDASGHFTKEELSATKARHRFDASIPGWPWTPRTTGWVEPTALFIIALRGTGIPAVNKRIASGVNLLLDRSLPSGGWNFGNPYSMSYELDAIPMSTALALAALGAVGVPEGGKAVAAGIRYLTRCLAGDVSTASLLWSLLALKSFPAASAHVPAVSARLAGLQANDGGFRGNLFETALAFLLLSGAPILESSVGGKR